ncbi:hypothetical protein [Bradyrhizobium sp. F1.4.3]
MGQNSECLLLRHCEPPGPRKICKFNALRLRYDPGTKTTSFIAE